MDMERVGFIGCGNIADAIIGGMVGAGYIKSDRISVYDLDGTKAFRLSSTYGVASANSAAGGITIPAIRLPNFLPDRTKRKRKKKRTAVRTTTAGTTRTAARRSTDFEMKAERPLCFSSR